MNSTISIKGKVDLGFVDLELIDKHIIRSKYNYDVTLDLEKAKLVHKKIGELSNGKAMLQLFIACPGLDVEKEVREWGAIEDSNKYTIASAIVCNSLAHKLLGNFFIKVQKPLRPTKMFSSEEEAVIWLKSFIK